MSGPVCLIVDDEPTIRHFLQATLEREQLQTLEAGTGAQAMGIIQKLAGRLDLVVTDIVMPGDVSGIDLAHWVRHSYPAIPVILISGHADEQMVRQLPPHSTLMRKPFVMQTFLNVVQAALKVIQRPATQAPGHETIT